LRPSGKGIFKNPGIYRLESDAKIVFFQFFSKKILILSNYFRCNCFLLGLYWCTLMNVTVLIENSPSSKNPVLKSEHGLSLLVHFSGKIILFDTGASGRFIQNAKLLGEDIKQVHSAVISHSHYDHSGGLMHFFRMNKKAPVYIKKEAFSLRHFSKHNGTLREIGMDKKIVEESKERFKLVSEDCEIAKNVWLLSDISSKHPLPKGNTHLFMDKNKHDTFGDELVLLLQENENLVILSGCSHRGLLNIIETVTERFPDMPIKGVIGGFHLVKPAGSRESETQDEVHNIAGFLNKKTGIRNFYTGHCTSDWAYEILHAELGGKMQKLRTGAVINI
jgi:7,8-dihydropterin-6-yl-methyl-4-(beta-D-ribofuranosyl)aminobenzene 5'-phosphate synthase